MNLRIEKESVFMCCGKAKCPAIKKTNETTESGEPLYSITDDFGGSIKVTESQALIVSEAAEKAKEIYN